MHTTPTTTNIAQDAGQTLTSYPPKPEGATHFQRNYGYEPAAVIRWEWSTTFGRWCALVKFEDGSECFTWPKPYPHIAEEPARPASAPQAHSNLEALLIQANPRSRFWLQDGIANGDLDEAADDFAALNNPGGAALANAILVELGQEPYFALTQPAR